MAYIYRMILILASLLILLALFIPQQSCVNNNEEDLYGGVPCDTIIITWDAKIQAVLQKYCVECHNANFNYKNIRHDTYTEEVKVIQAGRLRGSVNHLDGYTPMPFERGKLPSCELLQINLWLDRGFPKN